MTEEEQPTITQFLKPCPFCGSEPALDAAEVDEPSFSPEDQLAISWIVGCSCSAFLGPFLDDAEAIAAWNNRTSLAAQDGLVEALDDATIDEIILNFAGGIVQVPSKHNPRGYVSYYRPREAMRAALTAIKGDKS